MAVAANANFTVAALLTPPRAADQQAMQHHNTTQTTTTAANKQLQLLLVAVVALLVFCGFHFFSYFHLFYLQFWTFLAAPLRSARPRPRESATRRAHFICYCCFIYLLPRLTVFVCLWLFVGFVWAMQWPRTSFAVHLLQSCCCFIFAFARWDILLVRFSWSAKLAWVVVVEFVG